jgi:ankyrin repeat protein
MSTRACNVVAPVMKWAVDGYAEAAPRIGAIQDYGVVLQQALAVRDMLMLSQTCKKWDQLRWQRMFTFYWQEVGKRYWELSGSLPEAGAPSQSVECSIKKMPSLGQAKWLAIALQICRVNAAFPLSYRAVGLQDVCGHGDLNKLNQHLAPGRNPNLRLAGGRTALMFCCDPDGDGNARVLTGEHEECVDELVQHPAIQLNMVDYQGRTALAHAERIAEADEIDPDDDLTVQLLREKGAQKWGTPLDLKLGALHAWASYWLGDILAPEKYKLSCARLCAMTRRLRDELSECTALFQTCHHFDDLRSRSWGELWGLLSWHSLETTQLLRQVNSGFVATDQEQLSPTTLRRVSQLDAARNERHPIPLIVRCAATAVTEPQVERLRWLAEGGAVNATSTRRDCLGVTPLIAAVARGHEAAVEALVLQRNIQLNASLEDGTTALVMAATSGRLSMVQKLLRGRPDRFPDIGTALIGAARMGHVAVVEALATPTALTKMAEGGKTALTEAARFGHAAVVKMLLPHLINPNIPDGEGLTPLQWTLKQIGRVQWRWQFTRIGDKVFKMSYVHEFPNSKYRYIHVLQALADHPKIALPEVRRDKGDSKSANGAAAGSKV